MSTNGSVQFVIRLINRKHQLLKEQANLLVRSLVGDDPNAKKATASTMLQTVNDLKNTLAEKDIPPWLSSLAQFLTAFINGGWDSFDFLNNFIPQKDALDKHSWVFDESSETPFDFDSIFAYCKKESRLGELFDKIVRLLEEIHASGEIDSVTMLRALGKVISTIKHTKDGSFFSLNSAWEFLISFLNNYLWGELSKLPGIGTALEALGKTIQETNEEMCRLHTQVKDRMTCEVREEVKVLATKAVFSPSSYNKDGHLLNGVPIEQKQLPATVA